MAVHTPHIEAHRPPITIDRNWMLGIALAAAIVLIAIAVMVALEVIGTGVDVTVAQVQKLSDLRASVGGGGFI